VVFILFSCHEEDDYYSPDNEEGVSDSVGDGVAKSWDLALRFILNCPECGSGGSRSSTCSQQNTGVHFENVFTGVEPDDEGECRYKNAPQKQADTGLL
jgi:hypothetical protein